MASKDLFSRLKRLFSTDVVIRNVGGDQLKVVNTDGIQSMRGIKTNALIDRFNRIYTTQPSSLYGHQLSMNYAMLRTYLYSEYDIMDNDAIVASVLDIIADECSLRNDMGEILQIKSTNEDVQKILYNLFYDVLNIEFNLWSWVRQMCKYGDFFLKLEIAEKFGVYNVIPYNAYHIERVEGFDEDAPHSVKFIYNPEGFSSGGRTFYSTPYKGTNPNHIEFGNYEMAHFRLLADVNYIPYGRCLAPSSKIYTENSIKEIKNIKVGDKVWTYNIQENKYEIADVLNTTNSGIKKIYKITTQHNEIKGSDNHPILKFNPETSQPEYTQIKDLKIGDYICHSNLKDQINFNNPPLNKTLPKLGPHDWKCDMSPMYNFPDKVTPEFARFWGFMLGDGWECSTNYQIGLSCGIKHNLNEYYKNLLIKFTGKENLRSIKGQSNHEYYKNYPSGWIVCSKIFHKLMEINGYVGKSYSKRLPSWIYECDEVTQLSLVKGLMDADGYINTDKWGVDSFNLTLNNKELLGDLKILLDRLKIKTGTIRPRKHTGKCIIKGVEFNARQSYDFTFYLNNKKKNQYKKHNILNPNGNFEIFKIKNITEELPEETYDIQVSKNSNFISDGIIVHNSFLEPGRKLFKQYTLIEDAALIHRITRSADKRIFYINVGSIPPNEVDNFMQRTIDKVKKTPHIDPETGDYNLRYNLQNLLEDIYIPVRGNDTTTKLDTAPGLTYEGMQDVEYYRDKLFAALKVPKAFMGYSEDLEGKSTLAAMDIRFARTIDRLQRIMISELHKIALIHLYSQGYTDENLVNFELSLTTPSIIYDQERIMLLKEKVELSTSIIDNKLLPTDWVYENIFHLSQNEIEEYRDLILSDTERKFRIDQIENEGNDPYTTGESYGTPHDLAYLYGSGRYQSDPSNLPDGYDEKIPLGRPKEKTSNINTQKDPFGKDRLGRKANKEDDNESDDIKPNYKGGSPLALENVRSKIEYSKHKKVLESIPKKKKIIYEGENGNNLLDESNIKE